MSDRAWDAVIVGAGVMGCAVGLELARAGAKVCVLEKSVPGAEASSAAAGMLGAQVESSAPGAFTSLCIASRDRFGGFSDRLRAATGIDVEHRVCGITKVAFDAAEREAIERHADWQAAQGLRVEPLTQQALRALEPAVSAEASFAMRFPDDGRVDPPRLLKALRIAAERAGASFRTGAYVRRVLTEGGRAAGVELESAEVALAPDVVVAAGSWTSLVGGTPLPAGAVRPARGQIVELVAPAPPIRGVVWGKQAYLSPRDDGRVLVGSTLEFVGFERAVTAGAVRDLLAGATRLVPALDRAELGRAWSSFRPFTPDERPLIGRSSVDRLWLATGHFRNGILLAPVTAEIVAALVLGQAPPVDPSPFEAGAETPRAGSPGPS